MKRILILVLALVGLAGCETMQTAVPESSSTVKFDKRLLQDCEELPKAESARDVALIKHTEQLLTIHQKCKTDKAALNREVKKAFNIKD